MKKKKQILRWTPEALMGEVMEHLLREAQWDNKHPGIWSRHANKELHDQLLAERYVKGIVARQTSSRYIIRTIECKKGWMMVHETYTINYKRLGFTPTHRQRIAQGYDLQAYEKKTTVTLFISNTGACSTTINGISRYLSLTTYNFFASTLSLELIRKLLCIRTNNEWLEPHLESLKLYQPNEALMPTMAEIRLCNSLQAFLTRINPIAHPLSADWFRGMPMNVIIGKLLVAVHLENPVAYLQDSEALPKQDASFLEDTIKMARQTGEKFWYNRKQLKAKHDEMLLISLEKDTSIPPISIAPVWRKVQEKFLPDWELIDEGKRLKKEGLLLRHCVGSYAGNVNSGASGIFSREYNGERYTLELYKNREHIGYSQCKGFANCSAPKELETEITLALTHISTWITEEKPNLSEPPAAIIFESVRLQHNPHAPQLVGPDVWNWNVNGNVVEEIAF